MNNDIQVYNYTRMLQEGYDGIIIQEITYLINKWKAGMEARGKNI